MITKQAGTVTRFIEQALGELAAPKTLTERNFVQRMLIERVAVQCDISTTDAHHHVSTAYGARFPHRVS